MLWRYVASTDTRTNLSDRIINNAYCLNATFASAHHPSYGGLTWCQSGNRIIYTGNEGVFSYDFVNDVVTPLLLQPRTGTTITYIHPVSTGNGHVFVTGLQSDHGDVGASGPIYSLSAL